MGNCCQSESRAQLEHEERIKRENERAEAKRQLEESLKNMANGGHQMLSSYTSPYSFTPVAGRSYFRWSWSARGSVQVTSFGVRVVAADFSCSFVEGLANYATFLCSWKPYDGADSNGAQLVQLTLDQYSSVDANTGEQTPVNTCAKHFLVDAASGAFVRVLNVDELVDEAVSLAVAAAGNDKTEMQRTELRRLLMQQRDVMIKGVIEDLALMWRCWVEVWTHCETDSAPTELVWGTQCARRRRVVQSDEAANKQVLARFYDDLFANMTQVNPAIVRSHVTIDKARQLQVFNGCFVADGIRCHQASYRRYTESLIRCQSVVSARAEFEGKRWVFAWSDIPELSSRAYLVSLFSDYAAVGGAFHDALSDKFTANPQLGPEGEPRINMFQMLIEHPFNTEPNSAVVQADQSKQQLAAMMQVATGAHSMFSGLSPAIHYPPRDPSKRYFTFAWPEQGLVKVCALGFCIRIVDSDVAFTQGLGTFILFDARWQRCSPADCERHGVAAGSVELFLESNILVNAQSGTEEPLAEPSKHMIIAPDGALAKIVNMDELVSYAIESAIVAKGASISAEERAAYRELLIHSQKDTLTKAVKCDLSFIWASWVQLWTNHTRKSGSEGTNFGVRTVELSSQHSSSEAENEATVKSLIHSVVSNSSDAAAAGGASASSAAAGASSASERESRLAMERNITCSVARQSESYKTLFESDTVRPFVASYEKVTETDLALHVPQAGAGEAAEGGAPASPSSAQTHRIHQIEFKNSRHVFIWPDLPALATKDYIQSQYQNYLDAANAKYAQLKAEKERR